MPNSKGPHIHIAYFKVISIDLNKMSDEEIRSHGSLAVVEYLLKNVTRLPLATLIKNVSELIHKAKLSLEVEEISWKYLLESHPETLDLDKFNQLIQTIHITNHKETLMSLAQHLHQQGYTEGILEGIEAGKLEGKKNTILLIVMNMLKTGCTHTLIAQVTGLTETEIQVISSNKNSN